LSEARFRKNGPGGQGFIARDYAPRFPTTAAQITQWRKEGKLQYRLDLVKGLRSAATPLNKLFDGANIGKVFTSRGA